MRYYLLSLLILFLVSPCFANNYSPGDIVQLIERDLGIPAHPGPGDNQVSFRFPGSETVEIKGIDVETKWLLVHGPQQQSGWIIKKYISTTSPVIEPVITPPSEELSWCPPKRSQQPHGSGRLRIASWNMANLHSQNDKSIYTGNDPSEIRQNVDYERIKCYVRMFDPDILAVQEVDGEEALNRVVDIDVYNVHVSNRTKGSLGGKQNTGFAYKKGLSVQKLDDFDDLDISSGHLRYGTQIKVTHNGQIMKLMSIHLKSGCFENSSSSGACNKLLRQIPILENWIDTASNNDEAMILLGDFNRRLTMPGDMVWKDLDDGQPANLDLVSIGENKPLSCRDNKYDQFIDHIIFNNKSQEWVEDSSFRHVTYRQEDKAVWGQISDHCPVVVDVWLE